MAWFGHPSTRLVVLRREIAVLLLAAAGGGLLTFLGVPAGWLSGAMLATAALGLARPVAPLRKGWFDLAMLCSGILIGSGATPEALAAAARYPGSLICLALGMLAIMLASGAYLNKVAGWTWIDSILASAPGALSSVVAIAQDKGADLGRIAVIQLFRILILVALLPSLIQATGAAASFAPPPAIVAGAGGILLLLAAGIAAGLLLQRLGVVSPVILGATLSSALLHGSGLVHGTLPWQLQLVVFVVLGAVMGGRVATVKRRDMLVLFPLAIGSFFVSMAVAFLFAWPAALLAGVPYAAAMIAFAPGGLEAMAILAFALGLDPLYVGAHHLVRFIGLGLAMPFIVARLKAEPRRP